ncbi:MAG: NRDE family protein [Steroidobacteraceae bacterium]
MCLLVLAWRCHAKWPLVIAANRDEYHDRPTAALAPWPGNANRLAGRDLRAGGTWLAVDSAGRFAALTNFRELAPPRPTAPTRGAIAAQFLDGNLGAADFLATLEDDAPGYAGFNLLVGDGASLYYASNRREPFAVQLQPGVYGLSNHLLDTPWPKVERSRSALGMLLRNGEPKAGAVFEILADRHSPGPATDLPAGIDPGLARELNAVFVTHPRYGTRSSTLVTYRDSNAARVVERSFDASGHRLLDCEYQLNDGRWTCADGDGTRDRAACS